MNILSKFEFLSLFPKAAYVKMADLVLNRSYA